MNYERGDIPESEQGAREDIRGLLQSARGLNNYHELRHCDEIQEILQRWPLLKREIQPHNSPIGLPVTRKQNLNITLVTGTAGGVGATTVITNLARTLQQQGKKIMVADLSPRQDLHFHLGDSKQLVTANNSSTNHDISLLSSQSRDTQDIQQESPCWLTAQLAELPANTFDHLLIDCPWHTQTAFQQACTLAGHLLLVTTAEPVAFCQIDSSLAAMVSAGQPDTVHPHLLINRFNFSVPLQRDIHTLLHTNPPIELAPAEIPHESRIVDCLARQGDIVSLVPDCDAAHSFHFLGQWLSGQSTKQKTTIS